MQDKTGCPAHQQSDTGGDPEGIQYHHSGYGIVKKEYAIGSFLTEGVHMSFIVFLDVDGVLNSRNTVERSPDGYRGVDHLRVKVLADVINK